AARPSAPSLGRQESSSSARSLVTARGAVPPIRPSPPAHRAQAPAARARKLRGGRPSFFRASGILTETLRRSASFLLAGHRDEPEGCRMKAVPLLAALAVAACALAAARGLLTACEEAAALGRVFVEAPALGQAVEARDAAVRRCVEGKGEVIRELAA